LAFAAALSAPLPVLSQDPGSLLDRLLSSDLGVTARAGQEAGKLPAKDQQALSPRLRRHLKDRKPEARRLAVGALALLGAAAEEAAPAMAEVLADPDPASRADAIAYFGKLGAKAQPQVPALLKALDDPAGEVRAAAADALGAIARAAPVSFGERGKEARLRIVGLALDDPDREVRHRAAEALRWVGAPVPGQRFAEIFARLSDKQPQTRVKAARALEEQGTAAKDAATRLVEALDDPELGVKGYAAAALVELGAAPPDIVPILIAALGDPDADLAAKAGVALARLEPTRH
jgi:HEAT repeat protein